MRLFTQHDESTRFNLLMAATVIPLLAIDIVLERLVHLNAREDLRALAHVSVGSFGLWLLIAAYCYCCWRGMTKLEDISQLLAWAMLVVPAISFLIPSAGRSPYPLVDSALARIDAGMHFHTVTVVHLVSQFPRLRLALAIAYNLLPLLILASLLLPPLCGRAVDSRRYVLAVIIAAVMTAALFALWPAAGPWTVEGFAPTRDQAVVVDSLALLKSGRPLPEGVKSAVVAFPSFHVVLAVLSVIAMWNLRWARWFVFTVGMLVCVSTITTGWHYAIDVIGGLAVTYLAQATANLILRPEPSPAAPAMARDGTEIPAAAC
jgi:membrane-associated phospholipid phosphatase